jgi:hypothetical protein
MASIMVERLGPSSTTFGGGGEITRRNSVDKLGVGIYLFGEIGDGSVMALKWKWKWNPGGLTLLATHYTFRT